MTTRRIGRAVLCIAAVWSAVGTSAGAQDVVSGALGQRADSVATAAAAAGFSGVVRIDRGGTTILEKGYGFANRATKTPFGARTVVQIGSNTKEFTAIAILQLQDRGLLHVRDTIGKYFPEAPADKRGIRILQVINHRAGFPDFVAPPGTKDADFEPVGREEFLRRLFAAPLIDKPGADEHYSNAGFSLLAALIERLTHVSYDEYVRDNIVKPLGLTNTGFAYPQFDPANLTHGYRAGTDIGTILSHPHPNDGPYWNLRGNGGMLSTVGEMHTFYDAVLTRGMLLKAETREIIFPSGEPVGLAGSDRVSFFVFERYPRFATDIIVTSNNSDSPAPRLRRALSAALGLPGGGE